MEIRAKPRIYTDPELGGNASERMARHDHELWAQRIRDLVGEQPDGKPPLQHAYDLLVSVLRQPG